MVASCQSEIPCPHPAFIEFPAEKFDRFCPIATEQCGSQSCVQVRFVHKIVICISKMESELDASEVHVDKIG